MSRADLAVSAVALACFYSLWWCLALARRLRRIERTSRLDPWTGLGSGCWLDAERWPAALRSGRPLGVVYLDLDRLKVRQDCLGHAVGDAYLQTVADALRSACRRGVDEVFRASARGDAFVLLLHGPIREPSRLASALLQRLRRGGVHASLGLAYTAETGFLPARVDLRVAAEAACRKAKRCGGNCAVLVLEDACGTLETRIRADEASVSSSVAEADNIPTPIIDPGAARLDRVLGASPPPSAVQR